MSSNKFRTILVGCGSISRHELAPLTQRDDVAMVALVDVDPERAKTLASDFNLTHVPCYTDLEEALKEEKPDVVVDCTPPAIHRRVVTSALAHGCHVLGQKPFADTLENARFLLNQARETDRTYAIIQTVRFNPIHFGIRDFLANEPLGALSTVDLRYFAGLHFPEGDFRRRMKHVLLLDMAIHHFDLARMLTGKSPVSVFCADWNPDHSWFDHGANAVVDFEMSDGLRFVYSGSWCTDGGTGTEWTIVGERGTLASRQGSGLGARRVLKTDGISAACEDIDVSVPKLDKSQTAHHGAVNDFFDALRDGRPPMCPAEDNFKSFAMVEAAIRSAESGKRVNIDA